MRHTPENEQDAKPLWRIEGDWVMLNQGDNLLASEVAVIAPERSTALTGWEVRIVLRSGFSVLMVMNNGEWTSANEQAYEMARAISALKKGAAVPSQDS